MLVSLPSCSKFNSGLLSFLYLCFCAYVHVQGCGDTLFQWLACPWWEKSCWMNMIPNGAKHLRDGQANANF